MTAGVIDLSLLPAPDAIAALSYATIKADRLASLKTRLQTIGLPFDAEAIEGDPAVVLQEEDGWRELLDKGAINDAVRAVLAPYAKGTNLENVVARANVQRLTIKPADPDAGAPAVMESDFALLARYLDSFSSPAAGSPPGLRSRARAAWPAARDVAVFKTVVDGQPRVNVALLAESGAPVPQAAIQAVAAALAEEDAAPLTMPISVYAGTVVPWSFSATLRIPRGPDPALVLSIAERALRAVALERYRLGGSIPVNAAASPLYVPNVIQVTPIAPVFAGIASTPDAAPWLTDVMLVPELAT